MRLDQAFSDSFTRFPDSPAIIEGNRPARTRSSTPAWRGWQAHWHPAE